MLLTAIAMLAFAANSLLCRMALGARHDRCRQFYQCSNHLRRRHARTDCPAAFAVARAPQSRFACCSDVIRLHDLLFFSKPSWAGLALAVAGLVYLVSPGVTAPNPASALLMAIAGIAWGFYSLFGRTAADPMESTAYNFIYSAPLALAASLVFLQDFHITNTGIALAVASGAVASGLGYFVWYAALRGLTAIRAATVQLSVPVIAATGGVLLLGEEVNLRLVLASVATLGGIAIVLRNSQAH